ncbi:unnamed protein product [Clonostachys solani]|uniref:NmrA-like domain-containing protein n=1 Tax=Clonostachys solani TaxID=160281 RepID=A0A9N9Z132_9HYPO|nr:unnamed protein product [Clonostachys solani]
MTAQKIKVAVTGATGETGISIINALLESEEFAITAFVRPSSTEKPELQGFKDKKVPIVPLDLEAAPLEEIIKAFQGQEIIVSGVMPYASDIEKKLATAAKEVGVKRFIPSFFAPLAPPTGVNVLREIKEEVINHVKKLHLPYTVIDVGGWFQVSLPIVPSGKLDYLTKIPTNVQYGDGHYSTSVIDIRDIGKYVALIIKDPRTLNKYVFAYNEVWTHDEIFKLVEELSGETIERQSVPEESLEAAIQEASKAYKQDPSYKNFVLLIVHQYANQNWVRGDNLPETGTYLGYLLSKDLYPDFKFVGLRDFAKEALDGKAKPVYQTRTFEF